MLFMFHNFQVNLTKLIIERLTESGESASSKVSLEDVISSFESNPTGDGYSDDAVINAAEFVVEQVICRIN
jgi:hypothetical protein